jgi:hypothetical protein
MWKMRNAHCKKWNMARKIEKSEKCDMHTVGLNRGRKLEKRGKWDTENLWPGDWQEALKHGKMRNEYCRTWNMARKLKNLEKGKHTV